MALLDSCVHYPVKKCFQANSTVHRNARWSGWLRTCRPCVGLHTRWDAAWGNRSIGISCTSNISCITCSGTCCFYIYARRRKRKTLFLNNSPLISKVSLTFIWWPSTTTQFYSFISCCQLIIKLLYFKLVYHSISHTMTAAFGFELLK